MKEKFLPLGTVVLLKGATKRLIINGYCSVLPEAEEKVYDYLGGLFPEGNLAGDEVALFDHDQIEKICHMGLVDEEFTELNEKLRNTMMDGNAQTIQNDQAVKHDEVVSEVSATPVEEKVTEGEPVLKLEPIYTPPVTSELTRL